MAQKNPYLFWGRTSARKFRDLLRLFAVDLSAGRAAGLTGLHHNTTLALFRQMRLRMADLARRGCPFRGEVEIDESYFGATGVRGVPGRGAARKVPVFGILERGGPVHCRTVKNCSKTMPKAIIEGRVEMSADINADGFRSDDRPLLGDFRHSPVRQRLEAGFARHHRNIKAHGPRRATFSRGGIDINGIESFWSYAKPRHRKFNGRHRASFPVLLKETEFRFNTRDRNLCKLLLQSCRMKPLRRCAGVDPLQICASGTGLEA